MADFDPGDFSTDKASGGPSAQQAKAQAAEEARRRKQKEQQKKADSKAREDMEKAAVRAKIMEYLNSPIFAEILQGIDRPPSSANLASLYATYEAIKHIIGSSNAEHVINTGFILAAYATELVIGDGEIVGGYVSARNFTTRMAQGAFRQKMAPVIEELRIEYSDKLSTGGIWGRVAGTMVAALTLNTAANKIEEMKKRAQAQAAADSAPPTGEDLADESEEEEEPGPAEDVLPDE